MHGAASRSSDAVTVPALVAIVILSVPVVGTPDVGGVPTLAGLALAEAAAELGAQTQVVVESAAVFFALLVPNNAFQPPATKKTPTAITRTATPAAVCGLALAALAKAGGAAGLLPFDLGPGELPLAFLWKPRAVTFPPPCDRRELRQCSKMITFRGPAPGVAQDTTRQSVRALAGQLMCAVTNCDPETDNAWPSGASTTRTLGRLGSGCRMRCQTARPSSAACRRLARLARVVGSTPRLRS